MFGNDEQCSGDDWLPGAGVAGYVYAVTAALELSPASAWSEPGRPSVGYIALDQRLPGFPDLDAALLWDEESGWCAGLEMGNADDPIVLSWLGGDVLPEPAVVREFVGLIMLGRLPGVLYRPVSRDSGDDDGLAARVAAYARGGFPRPGVQ